MRIYRLLGILREATSTSVGTSWRRGYARAATASGDLPDDEVPKRNSWAYPAISEVIGEATSLDEDADDRDWLHAAETRTKHALQQFQLQAKLLASALTPNCALLKFAGSANLTVEQVSRKRSEFLTTYGLNIIAIRPEPGTVSLCLPVQIAESFVAAGVVEKMAT